MLALIVSLVQCTVPHFNDFPLELWAEHLQGFEHADLIMDGLTNGFDIGVSDTDMEPYVDRPFQLQLEPDVQMAISEWIAAGVTSGYILGPFEHGKSPYPNLFCSPLFAVPKPNGKWRPIHHLSYPKDSEYGISINSILDPELKKVHYTTFHDVLRLVESVGEGGWLWLVDAKDAYYRVPIKKEYFKYMGINWLGYDFIFTSLQMGLGTACQIYTKFADGVDYIVLNAEKQIFYDPDTGAKLLWHYLDDFFGGACDEATAILQFEAVQRWMSDLHIPTSENKITAPSQEQKILGFLYNTLYMTVSVPQQKIAKALEQVDMLLRRKYAYKKELEKLIG